jgi:tyrosine-protein kinase Etk/Wzc
MVVPENFERATCMKGLRDWTSIFYQFGLAAAALKVIQDSFPMNSTAEQTQTPPQSTVDDEVTLLDLLIVVAKHKMMIGRVMLGAAIASLIVSLLLSNVYTGTARLLPPEQRQSSASMLLGQLGGLAGLAGGSLGIKNPNDLYVGMLKSRTVADNIIERFELQKLYDKNTMVEARKALADNTTITAGKDGLITIEFDDEDPKRAAAVANAYVDELDKLTQSLAVTEAAQRRLFFERQLKQAKSDLAEAEVALKTTQEKTGLIKLDDQGRAIIEAVATLRAQISAKEVELRSMRTFATEQNSDYIRAQQQLVGLRAELVKLEQAKIADGGNILVPTGRVPQAGLEYLRKFRDVKYQETIFEVLAKQFEAAKIDEAKESAIVQVVDHAISPDRKSKPKRALIILLTTIAAGFAALLWAFVREARDRASQDPAQSVRLAALRRYASFR